MTTTMKTFLIIARASGQDMGLFEATSEDDAVNQMIRAAGYRDAEHEAEVLQSTPSKLRDELRVMEVDVPAAIDALAAAMVEADRESGDYTASLRNNAAHWDARGVISVAVEAGVDRWLARTIAETQLHLVRAAYAAA
jgi:hypothetical protein